MLIRFAVENYNSFKERQIFSMAAGKQTRHPSHCMDVNGKRLLKSSFFFGANASGKSNFVRAIDAMRRVILSGTDAMRYNDRYYRLDPDCAEKPGVFQMDYIANQTVYSYGFAIDYLAHEIKGEWLYRVAKTGKEDCIFERESGEEIRTDLSLREKDRVRFDIYCQDVKPETLLLKEIGDKNLDRDSALEDFIYAFNWFKKLLIVYPESHAMNVNDFFLNTNQESNSLPGLLNNFDTGIKGLQKEKRLAADAFNFLPSEYRNNLLDSYYKQLNKARVSNPKLGVKIYNHQFELTLENGELMAEKILLDHGNASDLFEISDESDGTQRLFDLIPLYDYGQKERIIIVDELDRSLHTKLTAEYIRLFFAYTKGKPSQFICTTHDLNLMNLDMLRQDEIWFVEREDDHGTKLYSLNEFKQRFDKNVLNEYMLGRYGAVPNILSDEIPEDGV